MSSQWVGDVFLSFRGEDTRPTFTDHLYAALSNAGFSTFRDSEELQKGEDIEHSLLKAIEGAKLSIIVFSRRYANSRWCMNELVKIMKCRETSSQIVFPVFYHVAPSDLRKKSSIIWKFFRGIRKRVPTSTVSSWEKAMTKVANIPGYHIKKFESEVQHIQNIVKDVSRKIDSDHLFVADHPVGIESRVHHLVQKMKIESDNVRIIGIWGLEGIGKTTIAKGIYNELRHKFEGKSFLFNIKDSWGQLADRVRLQKQLLSNIMLKEIHVDNVERGKVLISERLRSKKVLLVLDDIDDTEQFQAFAGSCEWFGPGSRLIITTTKKDLLTRLKADEKYSPGRMDKNEALELFRWHAFGGKEILDDEFIIICEEAVKYCGGLPLALEMIGSCLSCKDILQWRSMLEKLKSFPSKNIFRRLRISVDGLDELQKGLFLDICCFFIGMNKDDILQILGRPTFSLEAELDVLVDRCLVTIGKKNEFQMHGVIRDMGRKIVREESGNSPALQTRLWSQDALDVLTRRTGTRNIEGIALTELGRMTNFRAETFEEMKNLRLLILSHVRLTGDYEHLAKGLRLLYWQEFPLKYMPSNLYQKSLVAIDLRCSKLRLVWKVSQLLENLKIINLSHSHSLIQTPDFSHLPNLRKVILKYCSNLMTVHESIGLLGKLVYINVRGCKSLGSLPRSLYKSKSLRVLDISHCGLIDTLEEDILQMSFLTILLAHKTPIKKVPFSIVKLPRLRFISLWGYRGSSLYLFPGLIWSWMSPRDYSQTLIRSTGIVSSQVPSLWANSFLSGLSNVYGPWLERPFQLHQIRDLAQALSIRYSITSHNSHVFSKILAVHMGSSDKISTSGKDGFLQGCCSGLYEHPPYEERGPSVCFQMPVDFGPTLKGFALSVAFSSNVAKSEHFVCAINHTKGSILFSKLREDTCNEYEEWQNMLSDIKSGNRTELIVDFSHGFTATTTQVRMMY